ncbi:MAG: hypothetical protein A2Y38_14020 [Spirochaetes bacterium GWB1_59_5]|nr:MAG: hypothetical protein A2Y38_14020 [Spirochaetes bacterium GWB1_59_5]
MSDPRARVAARWAAKKNPLAEIWRSGGKVRVLADYRAYLQKLRAGTLRLQKQEKDLRDNPVDPLLWGILGTDERLEQYQQSCKQLGEQLQRLLKPGTYGEPDKGSPREYALYGHLLDARVAADNLLAMNAARQLQKLVGPITGKLQDEADKLEATLELLAKT